MGTALPPSLINRLHRSQWPTPTPPSPDRWSIYPSLLHCKIEGPRDCPYKGLCLKKRRSLLNARIGRRPKQKRCRVKLHPEKRLEQVMDGKRQLAFAIVKHLKNEVSSGGHDDDTSESLEGINMTYVFCIIVRSRRLRSRRARTGQLTK